MAPRPAPAVALADLTLSPLNARQSVPEAEIAAMADSIAAVGLLQNLIGHLTPEGVQIVGGGKRLRALQRLAAAGWPDLAEGVKPIDPVPVKVTLNADQALAWAGAENTARSPLHPADEVRAYRAMRERGAAPALIARTLAVTEVHVARRLRLADLPDPVLTALRDGQITLDVATALTLAATPEKALTTLESVRGRDVAPHVVRRELTPGTVPGNDRRAIFVGLDAYLAAGGTATEDLFQGGAYLHDAALLDTLFAEKGAALADEIAAGEGWKWAEFVPEQHIDAATRGMEKLWPVPGDLTEADSEDMDRLAELEQAEAIDAEGQARLDALIARMDGDFTDDHRATGGLFVHVNWKGVPEFTRGFRRRADQADPEPAEGTSRPGPAPQADTQSASLTGDLRAIRLMIVQATLLDQQELLFDLLAFQLIHNQAGWLAPLNISLQQPTIDPEKPDGTHCPARLTLAKPKMERLTPDGLAAFRQAPRADRMRALADVLARHYHGSDALTDALMAHLSPQPRRHWTPTAAGYFSRLPAARLDAIWAELVPATDIYPMHGTFFGMKKGDKARKLQALFDDLSVREAMGLTRAEGDRIDAWLPPELQIATPDQMDPTHA